MRFTALSFIVEHLFFFCFTMFLYSTAIVFVLILKKIYICFLDDAHVFTDKNKAFDLLKVHKEARLKVFKTSEDAHNYSQNGFELLSNSMTAASSKYKYLHYGSHIKYFLLLRTGPISGMVEKSAYRGPKSQDLVLFRKLIEQNKVDAVVDTIWKNPRYLIGSGDTPTILKVITSPLLSYMYIDDFFFYLFIGKF